MITKKKASKERQVRKHSCLGRRSRRLDQVIGYGRQLQRCLCAVCQGVMRG